MEPEAAGWYRIDGEWRLTTSAAVARAMQEHRIDDTAAREWQRKGAWLNVPTPTLRLRLPDDN